MDWTFWGIVIPCTLIPIVVAMKRKCYHDYLIYGLAIFFGWTVVGGIAAFLWALYGAPTPAENAPSPAAQE